MHAMRTSSVRRGGGGGGSDGDDKPDSRPSSFFEVFFRLKGVPGSSINFCRVCKICDYFWGSAARRSHPYTFVLLTPAPRFLLHRPPCLSVFVPFLLRCPSGKPDRLCRSNYNDGQIYDRILGASDGGVRCPRRTGGRGGGAGRQLERTDRGKNETIHMQLLNPSARPNGIRACTVGVRKLQHSCKQATPSASVN